MQTSAKMAISSRLRNTVANLTRGPFGLELAQGQRGLLGQAGQHRRPLRVQRLFAVRAVPMPPRNIYPPLPALAPGAGSELTRPHGRSIHQHGQVVVGKIYRVGLGSGLGPASAHIYFLLRHHERMQNARARQWH